MSKKLKIVIMALFFLFSICQLAYADEVLVASFVMALPLLVMFSSWGLALPVAVMIEGLILRRRLRLGYSEAFKT